MVSVNDQRRHLDSCCGCNGAHLVDSKVGCVLRDAESFVDLPFARKERRSFVRDRPQIREGRYRYDCVHSAVLCSRLKGDSSAEGGAEQNDWPYLDFVQDSTEVLPFVVPVSASIALGLTVRAAVVGDDIEAFWNEAACYSEARASVIRHTVKVNNGSPFWTVAVKPPACEENAVPLELHAIERLGRLLISQSPGRMKERLRPPGCRHAA